MKAFSHASSSGLRRSRSAQYTPGLHGRLSTTLIGARSLGLSSVRVRSLAKLATKSLPLVSVILLSPTDAAVVAVAAVPVAIAAIVPTVVVIADEPVLSFERFV